MRGRDYWRAEYGEEFKTCLTPTKQPSMTPNPKNAPASKAQLPQSRPLDESRDAGYDSDLSDDYDRDAALTPEEADDYSDDERADDLDAWLAGEDDWLSNSLQAPDLATRGERERLHVQEIAVLHGFLTGVVDEPKYYIVVNSLTGILTVRRRHPERGLQWERFTKSKAHVGNAGGKMHSSSSSSLSIHSHSVCVNRARRWCAWRSCWIYDVRPAGRI